MSKVNVVSAEVSPRLRLNLIAAEDIQAGELVFACSQRGMRAERTWRTLQIAHNQHIKHELLDYVDHSCEPNVLFDIDTLSFLALRDISKDQSITFFYPGAEVELAQDFICRCGSPDCLGHIKGGFYLTREQMEWALDKGYCTSFMEQHFLRFLEFGRS